jgi:hypothetical protein
LLVMADPDNGLEKPVDVTEGKCIAIPKPKPSAKAVKQAQMQNHAQKPAQKPQKLAQNAAKPALPQQKPTVHWKKNTNANINSSKSKNNRKAKDEIDASALVNAVTACIAPLAHALGLNDADVVGIADRVQAVVLGQIAHIRQDTYLWAEKINVCKTALAELHTRFHRSRNEAWLMYIANVYEVLHRVSYRLLRL